MSNLTSVDAHTLESVTGGASTTPTTKSTTQSTSSDLLSTLTSLSNTIKDIGTAAKTSGFSSTEMLMLGLLFSQNRQVNVFVRRPYW
jgi:hypothetical protein